MSKQIQTNHVGQILKSQAGRSCAVACALLCRTLLALIPSTQLIWSKKDEALHSSTSLDQNLQSAPRDIDNREIFGPISFPFFALFALCLKLTGRYKVIDRKCLEIKVLV